jgi:hypothetical protein
MEAALVRGAAVVKALCFVSLLAAFLAVPKAAPAESQPPQVTFEYSGLIDNFCANSLGQPVETAAVEELQRRVPELDQAWREHGPELLRTVPLVTGVSYRFAETKAALISCNAPSMSLPLMINTRPYLVATAKERPAPLTNFANTVFHEILHRYVDDTLRRLPDATTPLLRKYANEPAAVRNHVHLFALELQVYQRLRRREELERAAQAQRLLKSAGILARAREIVAIETPERLVEELRTAGKAAR